MRYMFTLRATSLPFAEIVELIQLKCLVRLKTIKLSSSCEKNKNTPGQGKRGKGPAAPLRLMETESIYSAKDEENCE